MRDIAFFPNEGLRPMENHDPTVFISSLGRLYKEGVFLHNFNVRFGEQDLSVRDLMAQYWPETLAVTFDDWRYNKAKFTLNYNRSLRESMRNAAQTKPEFSPKVAYYIQNKKI